MGQAICREGELSKVDQKEGGERVLLRAKPRGLFILRSKIEVNFSPYLEPGVQVKVDGQQIWTRDEHIPTILIDGPEAIVKIPE